MSSVSESETPEISSFERFLRQSDLSLYLPFILGFISSPRENSYSEGAEIDAEPAPRERIFIINPLTHSMVGIEGTSSLQTLLQSMVTASKDGQPPASKASIEAMPVVEIGENEEGECVVCLEELRAGDSVKEMPCKHRFHGNCVEKWLGIHGSCPVCRYKMPIGEDDEVDNKSEEEEREGGRVGMGILVTFSVSRRSDSSDFMDVSSPYFNF